MKLVMFLSKADSFPGKYYGSTFWAYFVSDDGYVVPAMTDKSMEQYAAMKLEDYVGVVKSGYESYQKLESSQD